MNHMYSEKEGRKKKRIKDKLLYIICMKKKNIKIHTELKGCQLI